MKKQKRKVVQVRLPNAVLEGIREIAKLAGTTPTVVMNVAVATALYKAEGEPQPSKARTE